MTITWLIRKSVFHFKLKSSKNFSAHPIRGVNRHEWSNCQDWNRARLQNYTNSTSRLESHVALLSLHSRFIHSPRNLPGNGLRSPHAQNAAGYAFYGRINHRRIGSAQSYVSKPTFDPLCTHVGSTGVQPRNASHLASLERLLLDVRTRFLRL